MAVLCAPVYGASDKNRCRGVRNAGRVVEKKLQLIFPTPVTGGGFFMAAES